MCPVGMADSYRMRKLARDLNIALSPLQQEFTRWDWHTVKMIRSNWHLSHRRMFSFVFLCRRVTLRICFGNVSCNVSWPLFTYFFIYLFIFVSLPYANVAVDFSFIFFKVRSHAIYASAICAHPIFSQWEWSVHVIILENYYIDDCIRMWIWRDISESLDYQFSDSSNSFKFRQAQSLLIVTFSSKPQTWIKINAIRFWNNLTISLIINISILWCSYNLTLNVSWSPEQLL